MSTQNANIQWSLARIAQEVVHPISQAPKLLFFFFFFENNLFYRIDDICNSISAYGKRDSLGADPGFFQRGGCKYEFRADVPGPKEC